MKSTAIRWTKKIVCRRKQAQKNCLQRQQHQKKLSALTKCPSPPSKKIMVRPLELANQMPVRNMDLARAPRRTARKKGSGYENGRGVVWGGGGGN